MLNKLVITLNSVCVVYDSSSESFSEKNTCSADYLQHFCGVNFVKGLGIR